MDRRKDAMRSATVILTWDDFALHPLDEAFRLADGTDIEVTYYINPVNDGTYIELCEFGGDLDRARAVLDDTGAVINYEMSEGIGVAYVHYRASDALDGLVTLPQNNEIVIQWPIEFIRHGDRGIRVTLVGTEAAMQAAFAAIPPGIDLSLTRTGEYEHAPTRTWSTLTDRQREVLDTALRAGYYSVPRETTHHEIADELGLAPATVSEHLQRIEARVMSSLSSDDGH